MPSNFLARPIKLYVSYDGRMPKSQATKMAQAFKRHVNGKNAAVIENPRYRHESTGLITSVTLSAETTMEIMRIREALKLHFSDYITTPSAGRDGICYDLRSKSLPAPTNV